MDKDTLRLRYGGGGAKQQRQKYFFRCLSRVSAGACVSASQCSEPPGRLTSISLSTQLAAFQEGSCGDGVTAVPRPRSRHPGRVRCSGFPHATGSLRIGASLKERIGASLKEQQRRLACERPAATGEVEVSGVSGVS